MEALSQWSGVPAGPLRLLFSLLATYPMGYVYRRTLLPYSTPDNATVRHLYNLGCGLLIAYFNYGLVDMIHFPSAVIGTWMILAMLGPSILSAVAVFIFAFGYLLWGYSFHLGEEYMIDWTTSYCVMCLRLIGFAVDYYDGAAKQKGKEKPANALRPCSWNGVELVELPSILETLGYCFHYSGLLVGPQFPFAVYRRYVTGDSFRMASKQAGRTKQLPYLNIPFCDREVIRAFILGAIYMMLSQLGQIFFPPAFTATRDFALNLSFVQRLVYMTIAGKVVLLKYFGVWLMNEGGCILSGLSFDGYDDDADSDKEPKRARWNGLANIDPWQLETITSLAQVVQAFNMNTNTWAKVYVFKKLKFLGSKVLSGFGTLAFLATWHGFAPGYYGAFFMEFLDMEAERKLKQRFQPILSKIYNPKNTGVFAKTLRIITNIFLYFLTSAALSYGSVTFDLLSWQNVLKFWNSMYHCSPIGVALVLILDFVLPATREKSTKKSQ